MDARYQLSGMTMVGREMPRLILSGMTVRSISVTLQMKWNKAGQ